MQIKNSSVDSKFCRTATPVFQSIKIRFPPTNDQLYLTIGTVSKSAPRTQHPLSNKTLNLAICRLKLPTLSTPRVPLKTTRKRPLFQTKNSHPKTFRHNQGPLYDLNYQIPMNWLVMTENNNLENSLEIKTFRLLGKN